MTVRSEGGLPARPVDAALFELVTIGLAVLTPGGRVTAANPGLCSLLGHTAEDLATRTLADLIHPDDWAELDRALADLSQGSLRRIAQRRRCLTADGGVVWVDLTVTAPDPGRAHMIAQLVDVTAEVLSLQAMQASAHRFRVLSENVTDLVVQTDPSGVITWASGSLTAALGWDTGLLAGTALRALVPTADLDHLQDVLAAVRRGAPVHGEVIRFQGTTGAARSMSVGARPVTAEGGLVTGIVLVLRDEAEQPGARDLAEGRLPLALMGAPDGMAVTDVHGRILQANPALCDLLAAPVTQVVGRHLGEFIPVEARHELDDLLGMLAGGAVGKARTEHRLTASSGAEAWVEHAVGVLHDDNGRPRHFVHQFADRTETRRMQADLTFRATHDAQTGLANRASLLTRLEARLGVAPSEPDNVGVLWCDIDNLKRVNDDHGHRIGDAVIASVADRLTQSVRHQDLVGRIGGDEFVIVLEQCPNHETLMTVAQNVQQAASGTVRTSIGPVPVTVSVGAVLAASTADPDEALSRADHALYRAKRAGRNRVAGEQPHPVERVGAPRSGRA